MQVKFIFIDNLLNNANGNFIKNTAYTEEQKIENCSFIQQKMMKFINNWQNWSNFRLFFWNKRRGANCQITVRGVQKSEKLQWSPPPRKFGTEEYVFRKNTLIVFIFLIRLVINNDKDLKCSWNFNQIHHISQGYSLILNVLHITEKL